MPPLLNFIGIALLLTIGVGGERLQLDPLSIGTLAAAALIVTAVWEWFSLNGG
jgi:hypothetical protein